MSDNENSILKDMTLAASVAGVGVGYGLVDNFRQDYANSSLKQSVNSFAGKLPGSNYLQNQLLRSSSYSSSTSNQLLSSTDQALQKTLVSKLMALEEMSPLHILRTLQLSNLIQPYSELAENDSVIHISSKSVRNQQHYYRSLINYLNEDNIQKNKRLLTNDDLMRGLFFKNNKIYGATKSGKINIDDVVVPNARLTLGAIKNGDIVSYNHVAEKFANTVGGALDKESLRHDPLIFVGSKTGRDFSGKWSKSFLRFSMDVGFKTLDNPLAGFEEMLHGVGVNHTGFFQSKGWQAVKKYTNIQLGTGGVYNIGVRDSLKISAKNIATKGLAAYVGYQALDSTLRTLSGDNGYFSQGLAVGLANTYAASRVALAEVWSDRFQGYKERQEKLAPGSTDLTTLLAFPLAGALLGSQASYFGRVATASFKNIEASAAKYNVESSSKILSKIGITENLKPMKKNALIGGLLGATLTLPFLPGALVGSSSNELRSLYSGEKEVEEKATKFWTFGGGAWSGSHTKYFTQNWVARMKADATDKVRYGDDANKKAMDPFLHPFSYLKDPYKFEKRNADSMPYPIWGMDVSFGGMFGKAFERTVGQIIKPDKLNPAVTDAINENTTVVGPEYKGESHLSDSPIGILGYLGFGAKKDLAKKTSEVFFENNNTNHLIGISQKDASLINEGLMEAPELPSYNPNKEGIGLTYQAMMDFSGIKGWSSSLILESTGLDPTNEKLQLARSGEASSAARDLVEQNLGDLMGCFLPSMRVSTNEGYKEIQQIVVGDLVLSKGGVYRKVKQVFKKTFNNIPIVKISVIGKEILCTPDHVFPGLKVNSLTTLLKDREIREYEVGDYLITPSNLHITIENVSSSTYSGFVYDLEIDGFDYDIPSEVNYYTVEGILCHNSGEFQRKILPTSSGAIVDRFNPIANNAPSWLPKDASKFYIDFKHGNMYDKVDRGEERLPGVGFAALNPEVKGVNPEDYPLVYRYKILSNVARGSKEFVETRQQVLSAYKEGNLSKREIEIVGQTLDQEERIQHRKTFYEKPEGMRGPLGFIQSSLWETMRSNAESPLEMLTPIRPAAKFLHKRTAIEDYMETQLGGSDAAIWTNPYSHFIKPTANKLNQSAKFSGVFKPKEFEEKANLEEYFDKLDYLRKRMNESPERSLTTVIGASMSGLNTKEKVLKFKASLSADQKDYFDSFSKETDTKKRERISAMLPEDVRRGYQQIWQNVDLAKSFKGSNIQQVLADNLHEQTSALSKSFDVQLSKSDKALAREKVQRNKDSYVDVGISERDRVKFTEDEILRMKMSDREALTFVNSKTGIPSKSFAGWDPRLQTDDIKIRTLSIGNQDLKRFGFWKQDEVRMKQLESITDQASEVTNNADVIMKEMKSDRRLKEQVEKAMFSKGFRVTDIDLISSSSSSILVRESDAERSNR